MEPPDLAIKIPDLHVAAVDILVRRFQGPGTQPCGIRMEPLVERNSHDRGYRCWIRYSRPGWRGMDLAILREQAERTVNNLAPSPYTGVRTTVDTLIDASTHTRATGDPGQVTRSIFTGG
jgi:hypothetical protein